MKKGFLWVSWLVIGILAGLFLLPSVEAALSVELPDQAIGEWAYRVLKVLGIVALLFGAFGRKTTTKDVTTSKEDVTTSKEDVTTS